MELALFDGEDLFQSEPTVIEECAAQFPRSVRELRIPQCPIESGVRNELKRFSIQSQQAQRLSVHNLSEPTAEGFAPSRRHNGPSEEQGQQPRIPS